MLQIQGANTKKVSHPKNPSRPKEESQKPELNLYALSGLEDDTFKLLPLAWDISNPCICHCSRDTYHEIPCVSDRPHAVEFESPTHHCPALHLLPPLPAPLPLPRPHFLHTSYCPADDSNTSCVATPAQHHSLTENRKHSLLSEVFFVIWKKKKGKKKKGGTLLACIVKKRCS